MHFCVYCIWFSIFIDCKHALRWPEISYVCKWYWPFILQYSCVLSQGSTIVQQQSSVSLNGREREVSIWIAGVHCKLHQNNMEMLFNESNKARENLANETERDNATQHSMMMIILIFIEHSSRSTQLTSYAINRQFIFKIAECIWHQTKNVQCKDKMT